MQLTLARRLGAVGAALTLAFSLLGASPGAATASQDPAGPDVAKRDTSHKTPSTYNVSTPYFGGYSKKLKAYKFTVFGRWYPNCDDKYCWPGPCVSSCDKQDIGSNDAVRIRFSDAVKFKKMAITNYGRCGTEYFHEQKRFSSGSFEDAYASVNDEIVTSWVYTWWNGETVIDRGYCRRDDLPTTGGVAGGSGGSGGYQHYGDLKGRAFKFVVWVNPLPSQGRCYDRLYVKAGYTHTWTDEGLAWSAGFPWSIGVGVSSEDGQFTVWQDTDGHEDPNLITPRMCHH